MQWLKTVFIGLLALTTSQLTSGQEIQVPLARDLRSDALQAATRRLPLMIIISQSDCSYCKRLKREIIRPMIASKAYTEKVIIRELLLDAGVTVLDFDGRKIAGSDFASRYREWVTPTLLFLSADGTELVERIRGINNVDYYGFYLDQSLEQALARIHQ